MTTERIVYALGILSLIVGLLVNGERAIDLLKRAWSAVQLEPNRRKKPPE